MFDMQVPWWEFMVRAGVVYLVLLVMVRLTGKRTVGQFTPFDLVVVLLLSEAVSGSINAQRRIAGRRPDRRRDAAVAERADRHGQRAQQKVDAVLEGSPVLIGRDGVIYDEVLKRERVPRSDMDKALREADCEVQDMRMAILEADGNINIMKEAALSRRIQRQALARAARLRAARGPVFAAHPALPAARRATLRR